MRAAWRRLLGPPHLPLTLVPPSLFVYYIQLSGISTCSLAQSGWKKSAHRETLFAPYLAWAIFHVGIPFTGVLGNVQTDCHSLSLDTVQWTLAEDGSRFCSVILVCTVFLQFPCTVAGFLNTRAVKANIQIPGKVLRKAWLLEKARCHFQRS